MLDIWSEQLKKCLALNNIVGMLNIYISDTAFFNIFFIKDTVFTADNHACVVYYLPRKMEICKSSVQFEEQSDDVFRLNESRSILE